MQRYICLIPVALLTSVLFCQSADSLLTKTFPLGQTVLHVPPSPFFTGRPYFLELVIDVPPESLQTAFIYFRTEKSSQYQELPLQTYKGRFRFKYDPKAYPGDSLTYFFVATTRDFALYATPLDDAGKINPAKIHPIDIEEFE